jgi:hypothetical protein
MREAMKLVALLAVLVYVVTALLLGMRLARIWWVQRVPAAGWIALALLGGAVVTNSLQIAISAAGVVKPEGGWRPVLAVMYLACGVGNVAVLRSTHSIFRPHVPQLHIATAAVGVFFALVAFLVPWGSAVPRESAVARLVFPVFWGVYAWAGYESFSHWRRYRRAPGLDPLVVDRLRMWGVSSVAVVLWVLTAWFGYQHPSMMLLGSILGLVSSGALWLAFLPPAAYRRHLAATAAAAPASARP